MRIADIKTTRFTDEQIIGFLKQAEAGIPIKELCPSSCFSQPTLYKLRSKLGGMVVSYVSRLRYLESENTQLKSLLAAAHLEIQALKSVFGAKR